MRCLTPPLTETGDGGSCGKCQNCRWRKQKELSGRTELELLLTPEENWPFLTFTYADENLPETHSEFLQDGERLRDTLNRRYRRNGKLLPYIFASEFGTKTDRPHHHMLAPISEWWPRKPRFEILENDNTWKLGGIRTEKPRSRTAVARYLIKYLLKDTRSHVTWSRGFGLAAQRQMAWNWFNQPSETLQPLLFYKIGNAGYPFAKTVKQWAKREAEFRGKTILDMPDDPMRFALPFDPEKAKMRKHSWLNKAPKNTNRQ